MAIRKKQDRTMALCILLTIGGLSACGQGSTLPETQTDLDNTEAADVNLGLAVESPTGPVPVSLNPDVVDQPDVTDAEIVEEIEPSTETPPEPIPEPTPNPQPLPESEPEPEPEPEPPTTDVGCTATQSAMQTSTLKLINDARAVARSCGASFFSATGPVTWNSKLEAAAHVHSADMADHNFFSHTGSDGSSVANRIDAQGYSWGTVGENIAAGQPTAEAVVGAWLQSPGHCANIMNPDFKETAVTCVENSSSQYSKYWTNVFGASL